VFAAANRARTQAAAARCVVAARAALASPPAGGWSAAQLVVLRLRVDRPAASLAEFAAAAGVSKHAYAGTLRRALARPAGPAAAAEAAAAAWVDTLTGAGRAGGPGTAVPEAERRAGRPARPAVSARRLAGPARVAAAGRVATLAGAGRADPAVAADLSLTVRQVRDLRADHGIPAGYRRGRGSR